ncbi:SAM-dependent methyltransferase [Parafrankia sp. BMG5.11]|uniref:SAM-dependent methyltransferase n=1 Tax=Parafrankia sp. BMG5.11 TaxID=222540 RepID=UPI000DA58F11|nr:SAM-dependent methyltransferase [Parafrankia sp. BMG5.11]SQD94042.1 putative S-adenosyl-L-methionine-dependent methyltransferase Franean1_4929 [Parafrankia sp. Ea1.12]
MNEVPHGVGRTALATAWIRAGESERPDRLFDDWLAPAFVAAAGDALPLIPPDAGGRLGALAEMMNAYLVVRTRFFDDELLAAAEAGVRQMVLLAAGLDSRAFRLPWPAGTRLFEVDRPDMLAFKERVLAAGGTGPRCERHAVSADLTEDWADEILDAGFRPAEPTAWLAEGIIVYLSAEEAERLLTDVTRLSVPGSRLALEDAKGLAEEMVEEARHVPPLGEFADLWKGGLEGASPAWLGDHGWRGREIDSTTVAIELRRPIPAEMPVAGYFVTAQRAVDERAEGELTAG